jgi:hypothetical protein
MKKQSRSIARKSAAVKKAPAKTSRKKAVVGRRKASRSVAGTLKKLMAR